MTGASAVLPNGGAVSGFIDEDVELAISNTAPPPLSVSAPGPPMDVDVESAEPAD